MYSIFRKEVSLFFNSLVGYIVIAVFLVLTGLMFWIYPQTNILDYGYAEMDNFFDIAPYVFLFLIPAVTMRMFSEEARNGTLELLFTRPISTRQIVLGKFLGSWLIVIIALIPTLIYYISLYYLGNPPGNIDSAGVLGSYIGLIFLSGVFVSIGIFTSTLSKNQIVAFILAAVLCYFFYEGLIQLAQIFTGATAYYINYFSLSFHYDSLSKGVIDSRNLIFFVSFSLVLILVTEWLLDKNRK
ncbi:MAG: gliding motility-associated ABC transporter permease subunit GldF [Cytophagaceae bacterium]|nr:gliding motility-associated ABC transporter permease subunit GldF [Cytophagaceae bacterium]